MNFPYIDGTNLLQIIIACVLSVVLFAALIIYIAKHPQQRTTPLKIAFIVLFLGGTILYCTCYYLEIQQAAKQVSNNPYLEWVKDGNDSWFYEGQPEITACMSCRLG